MLFLQNESNFDIDRALLEDILNAFSKKDVEILIINDKEMREINYTHRGMNKSTDVLSFPLVECNFTPLGSILINKDKVLSISNKLGHSAKQEVALLFTHGLLHLLGYDHENDNGEMRKKEEETIKKFNLPKSLIVRMQN